MTALYAQLAAEQLTGSDWTLIYTVPEGYAAMFNVDLINVGANDANVSVAFSLSADTDPETTDVDLLEAPVKAKANLRGKNAILQEGYNVWVKTSASVVNVRISGRLFTQDPMETPEEEPAGQE
jgi:hypothetical protein